VLHQAIIAVYIAAPLLAILFAVLRAKRKRSRALPGILFTFALGAMMGTGWLVVYAFLAGGRVDGMQSAKTIYIAVAALVILKSIGSLLERMFSSLSRRSGGTLFFGLVRVVLLLVIGLPYVVSLVMTYRPKTHAPGDPMSLLGREFSSVEFASSDGMHLSGWWIPAADDAPRGFRGGQSDAGTKTVLVCHGLAGHKSTPLPLVRWMISAGYNVMTFDFRAHGESDGQFTSMGALEQRDVLGAVRWIRENHPEQSHRIVGFGVEMGAAALIAAAVDPSPEGQAIESIVVYSAYDDIESLAGKFSNAAFLPPMDYVAARLGLPMASLHAGADLSAFKPGRMVSQLWPRPILVIQPAQSGAVPYENGRALFDAASFPKQFLQVIEDPGRSNDTAAGAMREFFDTARPVPAI
jgi:fermentation-respiration switch protein FrsA (DUF1100 family)